MYQRIACLTAGLLLCFVSVGQNHGPFSNSFPGFVEESTVYFSEADTIRYNSSLNFCEGGSVVLIANNAPPGATFEWKKDNTIIPLAIAGNYTATQSGSYTVIATSGTNTILYDTVDVIVYPRPLPAFSFTNNPCSGVAVVFSSSITSGTAPFTYSWNFGDGNTGTTANPSHVFESFGCGTQDYSVTLTVTDAHGCSNSVTSSITVKQRPEVALRDPNNLFSPFSNCANSPTPQNANYSITVENVSPNNSCITSYAIDWGDGNIQNNVSFPLNHTYTVLGAFNMVVTATGANGCESKKTYVVANQTNPAGSLGTLGATTNLCAPVIIPFTITNWQLNSPGTTYVLYFGDGESVTLTHPLNVNLTTDTVGHAYNTSSCPIPSYTAELQVINACANTPFSAGNIQISTKPQSNFTTPLTACAGTSICFDNTTITGNYGSNCTNMTIYTWDFGDGTPVSSSESPCHTYISPGTYTISLTSSNPCGTSTVTRQICVVDTPVPAFTLDQQSGCSPMTIAVTNTSNAHTGCSPATYQWMVTPLANSCGTGSWSFTGGTTENSINPVFLFSDAGTYAIRLNVTNVCGTFSITKNVTIKSKPTATFGNIPAVICQNGSITPTATVNNCYSTTPTSYAWSFPGGMPASSTSDNPGPIQYNLSGNYTISLTVTNECGSTNITHSLSVNPAPGVTVPPNQVFCAGNATGPLNFTSNVSGTVFNWTNDNTAIGLSASGTGSLSSFIATNNSGVPQTATITVVPTSGCSGALQSFTITVNPSPVTPVVNSPVNYCLNETAAALTATGTHSLMWYDNVALINGTTTAPVPNTAIPGNNTWYVNQTNTFNCKSPAAQITVAVLPSISGNSIGPDQNICSGIATTPIQPQQNIGGGNQQYNYQWQLSMDGGITWNPIPGATSASYHPGMLNANTHYRRLVQSGSCADTSNLVFIQVQGGLNNIGISASQTICAGNLPALLTGSQPSGGSGSFVYQWEQSIDNITWSAINGATSLDYQPPVLNVTHHYRKKTTSGSCSAYSSPITISVNPDAVALFIPSDSIGCVPFHINTSVINLQSFAQNSQYLWYLNGQLLGTGQAFPGYTMSQPNDSITIKLVTLSGAGCLGDSISLNFYTVNVPVPSFTINDSVACGPLTVQFNNTTPGINQFSYHWDFGNGQTSTLPQPGSMVFQPNPNYNDTSYVITLSVLTSCNSYFIRDTVRVKSKPRALFTPDHSVGCSPMTVVFNNIAGGIGNQYTWDFGDGSLPVTTGSVNDISHTFHSGVQDTFYVKLVAINDCGADSLSYAIVVSPNQIQLDFAINGNQFSGCSPHAVNFINNTSGATHFSWNFGDGNIANTTLNIDTVAHTYLLPGTYSVTLTATNGCSDTTTTETIIVYQRPQAAFTVNVSQACIGELIPFTNQSQGGTAYLWEFGDGQTSTLTNPVHQYTGTGIFLVRLVTYSFNISGTVCTDTSEQQVSIVDHLAGSFSVTDSVGNCTPFTVGFSNHHIPSVTAVWDFGDGHTANGNQVNHTYTQAGNYLVTLTVTVPGGCTYTASKNIKAEGPSGSWTHQSGFVCNQSALFQVTASNADSLLFDFGDGSFLSTTSNVVYHQYINPGIYFPSVVLKNNEGCGVELPGLDSIKIERIKAGFTTLQQKQCGFTTIHFTDTSFTFFGKSQALWNFGDGNTGTGFQVSHNYDAAGTYPVQLIVIGSSGCSDTLDLALTVEMNHVPVADIVADNETCERYSYNIGSSIQSTDAINFIQWNLSNGVTSNTAGFSSSFTIAGSYTIRLVVGTVNGCYDTVFKTITVKPSPIISASNDLVLCRGSSATLSASGTGIMQYNWLPQQGLNCYDCPSPVFNATQTTNYHVKGINNVGCSATDSVLVTVIQPMHINISGRDSICTGFSTQLNATGATIYSWSPSTGLNNTTISNPVAAPTITTTYRVVGYDGFNCFTDTAFITVAVGQFPVVNLGPDLLLPTGTLHPLTCVIQNGPVNMWEWSPATDLSCDDCPLPLAHVKKEIAYQVKVTTPYGCSATDSIRIKSFCEKAQVFIPNAFTPNGDGVNDVLMLRASGIAMVKTFIIFNRWGEVVFERSNFQPNDLQHGWDGRSKGVAGGPDVYVYTAEVICENGSSYTYKGNVTLLK